MIIIGLLFILIALFNTGIMGLVLLANNKFEWLKTVFCIATMACIALGVTITVETSIRKQALYTAQDKYPRVIAELREQPDGSKIWITERKYK